MPVFATVFCAGVCDRIPVPAFLRRYFYRQTQRAARTSLRSPPPTSSQIGLSSTFKYLVRKHLQAKFAKQRANCSCAFSECQPALTSTGSTPKRKPCFAKMGNLKSTGAKPFEPRLVSKQSFPEHSAGGPPGYACGWPPRTIRVRRRRVVPSRAASGSLVDTGV